MGLQQFGPTSVSNPEGAALMAETAGNHAQAAAIRAAARKAAEEAAKKAAKDAAQKQLLKECRKVAEKELKDEVGDVHKFKDILKKQFGDQLKDKNFDVMKDKVGNVVLKGNKTGELIPTNLPPGAFLP